MNNTILRIISDVTSIQKDPLEKEGIFIKINEDNIFNIKALIIGPDNTPYQGGFYFFDITFPTDYPFSPPKFKFISLFNNIRFNPNLYSSGKVCLSILNTWNGPGWSPCNTLRSVLTSLLGLVFIEHPMINEPGYDNIKLNIVKCYDLIITYYNLKIAINITLNKIPSDFEDFENIIHSYFYNNYEKYISNAIKNKENYMILQKSIIYECFYNIEKPLYDYEIQINKMIDLYKLNSLK